MGRVVFVLLILAAALWSLKRPWVGVVASYLVAILTPQAVWYWNFDGVRPALWLLLPTLLGHHDCAAPCLQQDVGGGRHLCWRHPIGAGASRQHRWSGAEGGRLIPQQ